MWNLTNSTHTHRLTRTTSRPLCCGLRPGQRVCCVISPFLGLCLCLCLYLCVSLVLSLCLSLFCLYPLSVYRSNLSFVSLFLTPPHPCVFVCVCVCPHPAIYVSSYYYICVLILLYMCPQTTIYVSSHYYYICVLIILYVCPHTTICVLLCMCPHTTIHVSSYCYICRPTCCH